MYGLCHVRKKTVPCVQYPSHWVLFFVVTSALGEWEGEALRQAMGIRGCLQGRSTTWGPRGPSLAYALPVIRVSE